MIAPQNKNPIPIESLKSKDKHVNVIPPIHHIPPYKISLGAFAIRCFLLAFLSFLICSNDTIIEFLWDSSSPFDSNIWSTSFTSFFCFITSLYASV